MGKRGQVYILAVLILSFVLIVLFSKPNIVREKIIEDDFEKLAENYDVEANKFINSLILSEELDIGDKFLDFTLLFSAYSRTQNPEFGLIYTFKKNDILHVGNYLDQAIFLKYGNEQVDLVGCKEVIEANIKVGALFVDIGGIDRSSLEDCVLNLSVGDIDELGITIDGIGYLFDLPADQPSIIIVSKENVEELSKVYMGGEFKEEETESIIGSDYCDDLNRDECYESNSCMLFHGQCLLRNCDIYIHRNSCLRDNYCCWEQTGLTNFDGECRKNGECSE